MQRISLLLLVALCVFPVFIACYEPGTVVVADAKLSSKDYQLKTGVVTSGTEGMKSTQSRVIFWMGPEAGYFSHPIIVPTDRLVPFMSVWLGHRPEISESWKRISSEMAGHLDTALIPGYQETTFTLYVSLAMDLYQAYEGLNENEEERVKVMHQLRLVGAIIDEKDAGFGVAYDIVTWLLPPIRLAHVTQEDLDKFGCEKPAEPLKSWVRKRFTSCLSNCNRNTFEKQLKALIEVAMLDPSTSEYHDFLKKFIPSMNPMVGFISKLWTWSD